MSDNFPERIVYVDDDQMLRDLVKTSLARAEEDFFVVTCSSGEELINRFRELQPDLILLDLNMPDMNGPDTIEALSKTSGWEETPFVFLTGSTNLSMIDEYKQLGVIGVVHKPFKPKELPEMIKKYWCVHHGVEYDEDAVESEEGPD